MHQNNRILLSAVAGFTQKSGYAPDEEHKKYTVNVRIEARRKRVLNEATRGGARLLGFEVLMAKMGRFVDGHEREDVVEHRNEFFRKMVGLGFVNKNNAPADKVKQSLPQDLQCPS